MNRRELFAMARRETLGLAAVTFSKALGSDGPRKRPGRGVSLAGAEFGTEREDFSNATPGVFGKDYTYNSERTVAYFCDQGLSLLRLPVRWERLQPHLGRELEQAELERLRTAVGWVKKRAGRAIIDIHNFGRYVVGVEGRRRERVIDQADGQGVAVSRAHFADLWRRLSTVFRKDAGVYAYGLMNEPHDMGKSDWQAISQAAVNAIRGQDDGKVILVAGDDWSSARRFAATNGPRPWIRDPAKAIAYEAHCYFDHDESGRYVLDYDAERALDARLERRGEERLRPFVQWCKANRVNGFLGEFGVPRDEHWQPLLARFLESLDDAGMEGCYWAAGEWWGRYPLSIQPGPDFRQPAPQVGVLLRERRP